MVKVETHRASPHRVRRDAVEVVAAFIIAALAFFVVVPTFLFQPFSIPTGSLVPALLVGDEVLISKFAYGYSSFSLPFDRKLFSGRVFGRLPERGDVVVFKWPKDNRTDYIKRVVGLPGETIQMREGQLFIGSERVPRHFVVRREEDAGAGYRRHVTSYVEVLPGNAAHPIQLMDDGQTLQNNTQPFKVPPGHIFVLGDNRDNSSDSRSWGTVPLENIVGRAEIVLFSIRTKHVDGEDLEPLWQVWRWPWTVRWARIFHRVL